MSHHTVMLVGLVGDVALVALASVQLLAEARWRRSYARRQRLAQAVAEEP